MAILAENQSICQLNGQAMHPSKKRHYTDLQDIQNCPCGSGIQTGIRSSGPTKGNISSNVIGLSPNTSPEQTYFSS